MYMYVCIFICVDNCISIYIYMLGTAYFVVKTSGLNPGGNDQEIRKMQNPFQTL